MLGGLVMTQPVSATKISCPAGTIRAGESLEPAECNTDKTQNESKLWGTVGNALNTALGLVGLVAVATMILGGYQFMTAAGDAAKVAKAKNTVMYGIIGLIIAVLAFAIVNFVLKNVLS